MQGDGEVAGHTTDVSAEITARVSVLKGLHINGPILLPLVEDLPHLARPFAPQEKEAARRLADKFGQSFLEEAAPLQIVGSGATLNDAVDNGVTRFASLVYVQRRSDEQGDDLGSGGDWTSARSRYGHDAGADRQTRRTWTGRAGERTVTACNEVPSQASALGDKSGLRTTGVEGRSDQVVRQFQMRHVNQTP